ncbi:MAG: hypothetical protein MUF16_19925 [Burkholderiaceae bacterium]|jgi:hypothetical protein|nr:hypothetical protein [Burkholderiaceae bacterium]
MNDTKPAIASSSVWGAIIAGLSAALMLAGVKIEGLDDPELPLQISGAIGAVMALYGRLRATAEINGWIRGR